MRRRLVIISALVGWLSCTAMPANDDAQRDVGSSDASEPDVNDAPIQHPDTSHDVGHPADTQDTSTADVAYDDAGPPEWVSIRGTLPSFCVLDRATHPERLNQLRIRMSPCASRDNCIESEPIAGLTNPWFVGVDGTYAMGQGPAPDGTSWLFVSPLDGGPPIAAYRGVSGCGPAGALGGGRVAFEVSFFNDAAGINGVAFYAATIANAAMIDTPLLDDRTHFNSHAFPQGLYVTESALVAWISAGYFTDVSTGVLSGIYDASGPAAIEDGPSVVHDIVMLESYATPPYVVLGHAGTAGGVAYYRAPGGVEVENARTDATDVGWVQCPTGSATPPYELWTAPFVESPTDLRPRLVRSIDVLGSPVLGAGAWVVGRHAGGDRVELYDLADGRSRTYLTPTEIATTSPMMFVASDRVIYAHPTSAGDRLVQFDPRLVPYDP